MKTIHFDHTLLEKEISYLQELIGKDLCGIDSDSISIEPSHPEKWNFHKWIEFSNWNDNIIQRLEYSFDETYCGNDFIELRIESSYRERRALNANISFSGKDKLTILKIETYGYDSEYLTSNICGDISKVDLKKNEQYNEKMTLENSMLLYGTNGKRIWIECQYPYLNLIVTMDEVYIQKILSEGELEFNAKMNLKREIK
jgi:hypothetical protein